MKDEKTILIATVSQDARAFIPVVEKLTDFAYDPVIFQTDRVLQGEDDFSLTVDGQTVEATYNGRNISPSNVASAWYRKPGTVVHDDKDVAKNIYLNNELSSFNDSLWTVFPEDVWLNSPAKIKVADRKLGQLLIAKETGFSVPKTVVGNNWGDISSGLAPNQEEIIVKTIKGVIADNNFLKAMFTHRLGHQETVSLASNDISPYLGIYQPYIKKQREWRTTVVGESVFSASIYTHEDAKDDWRKHQTNPNKVEFKKEKFPDELSEKCIKYLGKMGLKYGAFDFIETPDGEIVFLECNPNGQYGWLEEELGFPISECIATELIKIANRS